MDIRTKRLRELFNKSGFTQTEICNKTGINKGALSSYLSGRYFPKQDALEQLSSVFDVSIRYLMGISNNPNEDKNKFKYNDLEGLTNISFPAARAVPILGDICAGNGVLCEENYIGNFFIDNSVKADFCVNVRGDSMIEAGIYDGDMAFIKQSFDYHSGNIYAVRINSDCQAVLKKVTWQGDTIILSPCNTNYDPIVSNDDGVSILGEFVGVYHSEV